MVNVGQHRGVIRNFLQQFAGSTGDLNGNLFPAQASDSRWALLDPQSHKKLSAAGRAFPSSQASAGGKLINQKDDTIAINTVTRTDFIILPFSTKALLMLLFPWQEKPHFPF